MKGLNPMASCKLADADIVEILTTHADLPNRAIGRIYGVSASTIDSIRRNERYRWVAPEVRRPFEPPPGVRCTECIHDAKGRCSMEFPERAGKWGNRAATICAAYAVVEGVVF
jgi:hypothetical protein